MAYKLDAIDKQIIFELDRNARIPETKLAKKVNRSKESVRYRIKKLQEEKILLGYRTWFDPSKLGFTSAKIYLNLSNNPKRVAEFKKYLYGEKRLFWLGIAQGAWNVGLTFYVKNNREFFDLKNDIYTKFKDIILDAKTGMLVSVHVGNLTFLTNNTSQWMTFFDSTTKKEEIDELDKKILKILYENSKEHIINIAKKSGVTADTVRERIKKLTNNKVITRHRARIDFTKLGYEFFKTFLYFTNLTKEDEARLMEYSRQHPNILYLIKQNSPWDVELEIMCENYLKYNEILDGLTKEFSDIINKVETAIMSEDYVFPRNKLIFE
jgi:DNA-binding Lrp family transcriptional regulator